MSNKIYVGDIGTEILLDAVEDISTQTKLEIKYKKPDGTTGAWSASLDDTTKAKYATVANDLDQAGVWTFQIYVEMPSWSGLGESVSVVVYDGFA